MFDLFFQVISAFFKTMLGSADDRTANFDDFKFKLEKFQSYMPDTKFLAGTTYKFILVSECYIYV